MPKNISKEKSINRTKTITELVICLVVLGTAAFIGKNCVDRARVLPQTQTQGTQVSDIEIPEPSLEADPNKIIFSSLQIETKKKFTGDLILVNNDHQYFSTDSEDLVSILSMNDETGRNFFTAPDYNYSILRNVYEPMAQMIEDFYELYQNDTLTIYGSYRSNEFQQQLYDQFTAATSSDDDAPIVAPPGFSEHETGYAFDFSETVNFDYQGTGDFAWLNENCYKYGFIIRYPADKEDITEYRYEPWHFRYVGIPHATYMMQNNICLEEYIELLRTAHPYDGEHLEVTDPDGASYEIFFFPSDDAAEFTSVPVPNGVRYDISGNNVDGFIVTVHKDEKVNFGEENPAMTTTTTEVEGTTGEETETTVAY